MMPDKIYAYIPDGDNVGTCSVERGVPHQFVTEEYIRKDALLEWTKEHLCEQGFEDGGEEHGYRIAMKDLIDKLNSL